MKGKTREKKEEDKESKVETRRHKFREQMWAEFQEFKKAMANEAEKFKALIHIIPGVAVPIEPHAKNVVFSPRLLTI